MRHRHAYLQLSGFWFLKRNNWHMRWTAYNCYLCNKTKLKTQNYKNHVRYYLPHHLFFYSALIILLTISIIYLFRRTENYALWFVITGVVLLIGALSFMLRQHYALMLQNRIVILELRFRYFALTQKRFDSVESQLSQAQLLALRFAPDDELPALVERTLEEKLTADSIKRSIKNWLPDEMRV